MDGWAVQARKNEHSPALPKRETGGMDLLFDAASTSPANASPSPARNDGGRARFALISAAFSGRTEYGVAGYPRAGPRAGVLRVTTCTGSGGWTHHEGHGTAVERTNSCHALRRPNDNPTVLLVGGMLLTQTGRIFRFVLSVPFVFAAFIGQVRRADD